MQILKADVTVKVRMGPFVDVGDGFVPEAGVTLAGGGDNADEAEMLRHNGEAVVDISGNTWAAIANCDGWYDLTLTNTQLTTEGLLDIVVQNDSVHLPVHARFMVVNANVYDSLFAAATTDYLQIDLLQMVGVAQSATDLKDFADAGYDPATDKVTGVKLTDTCTTNSDMRGTNSAATATALTTAQTDLDTLTGADGATLAAAQGNYAPSKAGDSMDMSSISGDSTAADNLESDYDGTGYAKTKGGVNIAINTTVSSVDTADTVFRLTVGPTTNDALNNMVVAVWDVSGSEWQARRIDDYVGSTKQVTVDADFTFPLASSDIVHVYRSAYATAAASSSISQSEINSIADQVWDETRADHLASGSTGRKLGTGGRYGF